MKIYGLAGTLLFMICLVSLSASALSMRGDVLWNDEPMTFSFIMDGSRYVLKIENQQNRFLRVLADMESGDLLVIDDLMEQFSTVNSKQLIAMTVLLAWGKILGVEDTWLQGNTINFFPSGETKTYEPFGECIRLRVNNTVSGMYWSMQLDNVFAPVISPFLQKLNHDGIRFPFWESIVKMKGFVVANEKDQKTLYRLIEIGNLPLDWETEAQHPDYEAKEWVDFLSPFKGEI